VLRGLQPDRHSIEDNIIIYAGVSSYIGSARGRQDNKIVDGKKRSQMLNHIKDLSQTSVAGNIGAPAYTTDKQVFHTDAGDIVSLFALNTAAKGGESKLASSWRVYNELARMRPDIIKTLSENWDFDGCVFLQLNLVSMLMYTAMGILINSIHLVLYSSTIPQLPHLQNKSSSSTPVEDSQDSSTSLEAATFLQLQRHRPKLSMRFTSSPIDSV